MSQGEKKSQGQSLKEQPQANLDFGQTASDSSACLRLASPFSLVLQNNAPLTKALE